jgi:hypothetical protein
MYIYYICFAHLLTILSYGVGQITIILVNLIAGLPRPLRDEALA